MKIGIYGGSFNPVHLGHIGIVKRAIEDLGLDLVKVVVANVSPFKTDTANESFPWNREELVRAAFADMPKVEVDDRELRRGGVSYAIDTVREIAAEHEGAELYFIIGEDSLEGLPRWKDYEELTKLCSFKAYPRTKESSSAIRKLFADNKVVINPDSKLANVVRQGVVRKNGFCPCRLPKLPEFFCPCDEFKGQLADLAFHGLCHCRLYRKP